jgi:hypothetical protein
MYAIMGEQFQNDESSSARLEYFAERLNLVFSYFFCTLEFSEDEDFAGDATKNDRTWALQTIHEACLHTTLIALRDLDDFLTPRTARSKEDDLKASDFGFPHAASFLTESERTDVNKKIVHSTLPGVHAEGFRWDVFEMATKGIRQSMQFLEWAEQHFGLEHFLPWTAAFACRRKTQAIYDYIAKQVERHKANHETGNA